MAGNINKYPFLLAITVVLLNVCISADNNPCLLHVTDSTAIDLTNISSKVLQGDFGTYKFSYSPCRDTNFISANCTNTTLCLLDTKTNVSKGFGFAKDVAFYHAAFPYQLTFSNKSAVINLVCTEYKSEPTLLINKITNNELYLLANEVCLIHHEHHNSSLSNGSVLLILLFVGFSIYMIGGAIVLYTLRGARGLEMIPNIDFWRGLPLLVRDGFLYLMNGCTLPSTVTTTAETYDRI